MEQLMQIMTGRPGIDVILLNTGTAVILAGIMLLAYRFANTKASFSAEICSYSCNPCTYISCFNGTDTVKSGIVAWNAGLSFYCAVSDEYT